MVSKTPNERQQAMIAAYKSGLTLQEVGEQFGVTRERVRQVVTKFGHSDSFSHMTPRRLERKMKTEKARAEKQARKAKQESRRAGVIADYRTGLRLIDIVRKYGYGTPQSLNRQLRRFGEPPRRRLEVSERLKKAHAEGVHYKEGRK